jgi:hypothetical protein
LSLFRKYSHTIMYRQCLITAELAIVGSPVVVSKFNRPRFVALAAVFPADRRGTQPFDIELIILLHRNDFGEFRPVFNVCTQPGHGGNHLTGLRSLIRVATTRSVSRTPSSDEEIGYRETPNCSAELFIRQNGEIRSGRIWSDLQTSRF